MARELNAEVLRALVWELKRWREKRGLAEQIDTGVDLLAAEIQRHLEREDCYCAYCVFKEKVSSA